MSSSTTIDRIMDQICDLTWEVGKLKEQLELKSRALANQKLLLEKYLHDEPVCGPREIEIKGTEVRIMRGPYGRR